jgi:hypothetical protein
MDIDVVPFIGEVFLPVKDDRRYAVSSLGRVYAFKRERVHGGLVTQFIDSTGYYVVNIGNKQRHVHRLVVEAFVPNINNLPEVNHKDGDKANNNLTNLEWSSYRNNLLHAYRTGLHKPKGKAVVCFNRFGVSVKHYENIVSVTADGFSPSLVCRCAKGKQKTHKGRIWKYA